MNMRSEKKRPMDKLYVEIGARMRALRKALKMTQAQAAEAAEIDSSFYGQIERGANVPSLKTFLAIARALKAEPADLLPAKRGANKAGLSYAEMIEKMFSGLSPQNQKFLFGAVSDMAGRLKK